MRLAYAEALRACEQQHEARAAIAAARDRLLHRAAQIVDEESRRCFLEAITENARMLALAKEWGA